MSCFSMPYLSGRLFVFEMCSMSVGETKLSFTLLLNLQYKKITLFIMTSTDQKPSEKY